MEQYIPKSALVAEIERLRENQVFDDRHSKGVLYGLHTIEKFLDTLEVREVEDSAAADMAEEIIVNLKRVENDYHIDLTKQMEWLRNIVKERE